MQIKDHYKTLGITPQATLQEIKTAYRRLAHQYHPDKNTGDQYATHYFHDIREAYEILSHPKRRVVYDEERWLSGYAQKQKPVVITPAWIYNECLKLAHHMSAVDTYRMSQAALYEYTLLLLSDTHLAILNKVADKEINKQILREMLRALNGMQYRYFHDISGRLTMLAGDNTILLLQIDRELARKAREMQWQRIKPWMILMVALLLCVFMFLYIR